MKKKEAFILALLIFANLDGFPADECPNGQYALYPSVNGDCPDSLIRLHSDLTHARCCDDVLLCTGSGMVAHFCQPKYCTLSTPIFLRDIKYTYDKVTVQMGTEDYPYLCPKPMSHLHAFHYDNRIEDKFPPAYMPVDFKDMDSVLSTCSSNKGCADGQFCGYVVNYSFDPDNFGKCSDGKKCSKNSQCSDNKCTEDRSILTYVDKEKKFCYKLPEIPDKNVKMVFEISENTVGLRACDMNDYCDEYCNLGLIQEGSFGSYNPTAKKTTFHKGLCMESRPFAFLFADFFGDNNNVVNGGVVGDEVLPYMPPGMVVNDRFYKTRLTNCAFNKDCAAGYFCDYRYSLLLDQGHLHKRLKYCYKIPALSSSNASMLVEPDRVSLSPCTTDTDCEVGYCVLPASTSFKFAKFVDDGSSPQMHSGLYVEGERCDGVNSYNESFEWDMSWGKCTKNEDCVDHGRTKVGWNADDWTYESTCVLNNGVGVCCYREAKKCSYRGKVVEPSNRCGKSSSNDPATSFADCYGGIAQLKLQTTRLDKWCDLDSNQCCQQKEISYFCPDGQTPLFNEPTCSGYDDYNEASGNCQGKRGAVCKLGHCCPETKVDSSGNVTKGTDSYETNVPCTPGVRPPQFPNGYCDPTTDKVVIIGQNAPDGNPFEHADPATPKVCQSDADCSNDQSTICIFVEPNVAHCFKNPKSSSPPSTAQPVVTPDPPAQTANPVDSSVVVTNPPGITVDPQSSSTPRADGQGTDSEEEKGTYYIIVVVLILALILIIIAVIIGIIVFMKNKKGKKPAKKGKNGKNGNKNEKDTKKKESTGGYPPANV